MRVCTHSRSLFFGAISTVVVFIVLSVLGCKKEGSVTSEPSSSSQTQLVARGKAVYMSNCTACHNLNPKTSGALGPEVWGSSRELLEARILKAEYPVGYRAKRETRMMVALPQLKDEIDSLYAFLNNK